ncbi:MAG: MASE1 domain-containing protein [Candidatus Competibacteraceae bacterium]
MGTILRFVLRACLLIGAYYLAGQAGLFLRVAYADLTPLWPPSGIAVALLWVYGRYWWPVIPCGEYLIAWGLGQPVLVGIGGAAAQLLEAYLAYYLLRTVCVNQQLNTARDVLNFTVFGAFAPPIAAAAIGVWGWHITDFTAVGSIGTWFTWWLGDAMGILIVTPFLACLSPWPTLNRRALGEWLAILIALLITCVGLFLTFPRKATACSFSCSCF